VNNTNLHPILHRFKVIADYWSHLCGNFDYELLYLVYFTLLYLHLRFQQGYTSL